MTAPDPTAGEARWTRNDRADHDAGHPSGFDCDGYAMTGSEACGNRYAASPPAAAASTGTSEDVEALLDCECGHSLDEHNGLGCYARLSYEPLVQCSCALTDDRTHGELLAPRLATLLAARESAARAEERERIAQAQRCGGCKGQGSHRRHCPRHPNYHPWIPLADRAESIGDSIGEPGLANQAWALAAAIRDEMPNHPYRPVRHREAR